MGHIEGVADSQVILVIEGGRLTGSIVLPKAAYRLRFAGAGVHVIYEIHRSACTALDDSIEEGHFTIAWQNVF